MYKKTYNISVMNQKYVLIL